MKTSDFIKENINIASDAHAMHMDHEVQMAREECYHIATNAIEMHKLLKKVSEAHGIDGWVSEKISLANDYMRTVLEYMEYELMSHPHSLEEDSGSCSTSSASIATGPAQNLLGKKKTIKRKMP